jgi:hypothetical protein
MKSGHGNFKRTKPRKKDAGRGMIMRAEPLAEGAFSEGLEASVVMNQRSG